MRLLVIGHGSIGARHSRISSEMGLEVACVTANLQCPYPIFSDLQEALDLFKPYLVIVANATAHHRSTLLSLRELGFKGKILIEKPIFDKDIAGVSADDSLVFVAYNLRFHPLITQLRKIIDGQALLTAAFNAGQYLPTWRPGVDYRHSYSAYHDQGGGVLRDLSHEIDLALWLCWAPKRLSAIGGHFSQLEIQSDDVYTILSANERCQSTLIAINYLERGAKRSIALNTPEMSIALDLIAGELRVNSELIEQGSFERDSTYRMQLEAFISDRAGNLCTLKQGLAVLRFIENGEKAATQKTWIEC